MASANYLLLVAGGTGTRMGNELPKQFIELNGKPVFCHSIVSFMNALPEIKIIISVHPAFRLELSYHLNNHFPGKKFEIADGGKTRFDSVKNGLEKITGDGIVFIHDAARPLVSADTITRCYDSAEKTGSAIPVLKATESLRKVNENGSVPVNRDEFRIVQTPQCFSVSEIKKAFTQKYDASFTDDATVFEKAGNKITLTEGNPENIKITFPADLQYAEFILKNNHH